MAKGFGYGFDQLIKSFWVWNEYVTILGLGVGAMVIMAPNKSSKGRQRITCNAQRHPYSKKVYADLFMAMYELFMLGT